MFVNWKRCESSSLCHHVVSTLSILFSACSLYRSMKYAVILEGEGLHASVTAAGGLLILDGWPEANWSQASSRGLHGRVTNRSAAEWSLKAAEECCGWTTPDEANARQTSVSRTILQPVTYIQCQKELVLHVRMNPNLLLTFFCWKWDIWWPCKGLLSSH